MMEETINAILAAVREQCANEVAFNYMLVDASGPEIKVHIAQEINEDTPIDTPILVGGPNMTWAGDVSEEQPDEGPILVRRDFLGNFFVVGGDYYAAWVRNPTWWLAVPEV